MPCIGKEVTTPQDCSNHTAQCADKHRDGSRVCRIIYTDCSCLSVLGLGSTATAASSATAATVLTRKVASRALATRSATLSTSTATSGSGASSTVAGASVCVGLGTSGLNDDALTVNGVGVGSGSRLVTLGGLVLDKGTVLYHISFCSVHIVKK
jgi:hypothetical protein